jgi:hypothetical protein
VVERSSVGIVRGSENNWLVQQTLLASQPIVRVSSFVCALSSFCDAQISGIHSYEFVMTVRLAASDLWETEQHVFDILGG